METITFNDVWEDFMYWSAGMTKTDLRKQMSEYPQFAAELLSFWKDITAEDLKQLSFEWEQ